MPWQRPAAHTVTLPELHGPVGPADASPSGADAEAGFDRALRRAASEDVGRGGADGAGRAGGAGGRDTLSGGSDFGGWGGSGRVGRFEGSLATLRETALPHSADVMSSQPEVDLALRRNAGAADRAGAWTDDEDDAVDGPSGETPREAPTLPLQLLPEPLQPQAPGGAASTWSPRAPVPADAVSRHLAALHEPGVSAAGGTWQLQVLNIGSTSPSGSMPAPALQVQRSAGGGFQVLLSASSESLRPAPLSALRERLAVRGSTLLARVDHHEPTEETPE